MKKTSIYLEASIDRELRLIAEAEGKSKAEVIREALADRVMEAHPQPRIEAIGVGTGSPGDVADNVDRYLEGFGED